MIGQDRARDIFLEENSRHAVSQHSGPIHSIPEAKAPGEVLSSPVASILAGYPFTGAERVPVSYGLDRFLEGATLEGRGDDPGEPEEALDDALYPMAAYYADNPQTPRTPG